MNQGSTLEFGPFRLEPGNAMLLQDRQPIALRPRSFAVLCYLIEHRGNLVTKEQLLEGIWPSKYVSEGVLKVCIAEIRIALGDDPKSPQYIETVFRLGYRFIGTLSDPNRHAPLKPESDFSHNPERNANRPNLSWVGRESPLAQLSEALQLAGHGIRQTVFVAGDVGIGKTTLVRMFLQDIAYLQPTIIHCRCIERFGKDEAFLPILEALVNLCRSSEKEHIKAILSHHAPSWLVRMPWILSTGELENLREKIQGTNRQGMLLEICEVLERLGEQSPLILIIDDLHWSDAATLDLLSLLARRRDRAKLLIVATYCPTDTHSECVSIGRLWRELQSRGFSNEISLTSFTNEEVDRYLQQHFPNCKQRNLLTDLIFRRSGGHAFFLANLVSHVKEHGQCLLNIGQSLLEKAIPERIKWMIESQIDRLSQREQHILEAASVIGSEFSVALLAEVLKEDRLEVENLCETMARQGQVLIRAANESSQGHHPIGRYLLAHTLYQDLLYQRLPAARLAHLHQSVGESLEKLEMNTPSELAAVLAMHFEHAADFPRAVKYLQRAANDAAHRFANFEAVTYLSRALGICDHLPDHILPDVQAELLRQRADIRKVLCDEQGAAIDLAYPPALLENARMNWSRNLSIPNT